MGRGDARHSGGRGAGTLALLLALVLVVGAAVAWQQGVLGRWLDPEPAAHSDPAAIEPPAGVSEAETTVERPDPVADAAEGADPALRAVRRAVVPILRDRALGRSVRAAVARLDGTGAPAFGLDAGGQSIPASTTKVVTAAAALLALGPDHVFETSAVQRGNRVVLVGGGDPFLERGPRQSDGSMHPYPDRADLSTLARQTAAALERRGVTRVRVGYDASLFRGPAVNPTWESDYVSTGQASPTSALWVAEGRTADGLGRDADPAAAAARAFARALSDAGSDAGLDVRGGVRATGAGDAAPLASVASAPLDEIVERILDVSDNDGAEVLLRHVGLAEEGAGSIDAGRRGVAAVLAEAGLRVGRSVLYDGSGLSRANRLSPRLLVDVLRLAASPDRPDLRSVVTGLPVAGFTGSLTTRLDEGPPAALGRVRAKTGTLTGVSALAGIALDRDGSPLVFVVMADRIPEATAGEAVAALDAAAAALGACRCG